MRLWARWISFLGFPGLDRSRADADAGQSNFQGGGGGKVRCIYTFSCVELGCGMDGFCDHYEGEFFDLQAIDASNFPEKETYVERVCLY